MYTTLLLGALLSSLAAASYGSRFEFVIDNDRIFESCPDIPEANGPFDVVDVSELVYEFNEGYVRIKGQMTFEWEGVEATDRIAGHAEVYRFQRGTWQPTMFSMSINDFCAQQFDETTIWYKVWSHHIPMNERNCINNYGQVYHYEPFDVETVTNFSINMEGRHKIVVNMYAFDQHNVKRPNTDICLQIHGEFIKKK
ncbi:uncharacterized protein [Musca autumnalis]|uniref:uncharacterized protein n=1 Tax=Musca autumnalis TaxID=221902 RepID=UPI003CFB21D7